LQKAIDRFKRFCLALFKKYSRDDSSRKALDEKIRFYKHLNILFQGYLKSTEMNLLLKFLLDNNKKMTNFWDVKMEVLYLFWRNRWWYVVL